MRGASSSRTRRRPHGGGSRPGPAGCTAPASVGGEARDPRSPPIAGPLRCRAVFVHTLRVRYGECDLQGSVINANYLVYYDVAFTELWREAVGPWLEMVDRGVDAVVAEANVRFRSRARYDDVIDL